MYHLLYERHFLSFFADHGSDFCVCSELQTIDAFKDLAQVWLYSAGILRLTEDLQQLQSRRRRRTWWCMLT